MKKLALLIAATSLSAQAMSPEEILKDTSANAEVMVVAHRADWRSAPENSIPAIHSAIEQGVLVVELDFKKTLDGHIVVAHDQTIDRTTNGSGRIDQMTLAQVQQYYLRGKQGGEMPITEYKIPTLEEVIDAADGRALINLDHAWGLRDDIYRILEENNAINIGLFKSNDDPRVVQEFLDQDNNVLYMHIVRESNADHIEQFDRHTPAAYEMVFSHHSEAHVQPDLLESLSKDSRIWVNSLWYGLGAGYTDEASHLNPDQGWGVLLNDMYTSMIQTDNIEEITHYIEHGSANSKKKDETVVVMADAFGTKGPGVSYYDTTPDNKGSVSRAYDSVDICDTNGAVHLCWIRNGEWINYTVDVPKTGSYTVSARVSARQQEAGAFFLEFEGQETLRHEVKNTSSHSLFFIQEVGEIFLKKGEHSMTFRVDDSSNNTNFNVNYFKLERN
ncbi:carbohydrate-binding protein [Vibrio kyushuensis]|uniref:glycerophosphodiester phosphodiesterase family protein n=1 Tax=Vibrio kyushuensis TaxID=2910249 RepID=UPI003D0DF40C